jgi:hypothetical protein
MPLPAHLLGYWFLRPFRSSAWRTGISVGVCLSIVLTAWLFLANRVPALNRFAWERNLTAAAAAGLFAVLPVMRFVRSPRRLFVSGLVAWTILSFVYRVSSIYFSSLASRMGAFHLFMLGSVLYSFAAVLAWIGSALWGVRDNHVSSSGRHQS